MEGDGEINNHGNESGGWRPAHGACSLHGRGSRTRWGINEPHSHPWTAGDSWGVALSPQSGSHQKAASVGVTVWGGGRGREGLASGLGQGRCGRGRGWHPQGRRGARAESETRLPAAQRVGETRGEPVTARGPGTVACAANTPRPRVRELQTKLLFSRYASL